MANYSELIATINDQIKANGNQEITGPVLNSVLQAMVSTMEDGDSTQLFNAVIPNFELVRKGFGVNPSNSADMFYYDPKKNGDYIAVSTARPADGQHLYACINVPVYYAADLPHIISSSFILSYTQDMNFNNLGRVTISNRIGQVIKTYSMTATAVTAQDSGNSAILYSAEIDLSEAANAPSSGIDNNSFILVSAYVMFDGRTLPAGLTAYIENRNISLLGLDDRNYETYVKRTAIVNGKAESLPFGINEAVNEVINESGPVYDVYEFTENNIQIPSGLPLGTVQYILIDINIADIRRVIEKRGAFFLLRFKLKTSTGYYFNNVVSRYVDAYVDSVGDSNLKNCLLYYTPNSGEYLIEVFSPHATNLHILIPLELLVYTEEAGTVTVEDISLISNFADNVELFNNWIGGVSANGGNLSPILNYAQITEHFPLKGVFSGEGFNGAELNRKTGRLFCPRGMTNLFPNYIAIRINKDVFKSMMRVGSEYTEQGTKVLYVSWYVMYKIKGHGHDSKDDFYYNSKNFISTGASFTGDAEVNGVTALAKAKFVHFLPKAFILKNGEPFFVVQYEYHLNVDDVVTGNDDIQLYAMMINTTDYAFADIEVQSLSVWGTGLDYPVVDNQISRALKYNEYADQLISIPEALGVATGEIKQYRAETHGEILQDDTGSADNITPAQSGYIGLTDVAEHDGAIVAININSPVSQSVDLVVGLVDQNNIILPSIILSDIQLAAGKNALAYYNNADSPLPIKSGERLFIRQNTANGIPYKTNTDSSYVTAPLDTQLLTVVNGRQLDFRYIISYEVVPRYKIPSRDEFEELKQTIISQNTSIPIYSPDGTKWYISVDNNGVLKANRNTFSKLCIIGNSITWHPITDYWWGTWGMAASVREKDYAHLILERAKKSNPQCTLDYFNFAEWETASTSSARSALLPNLDTHLSVQPDCVIIRLSENIQSAGLATLEADYKTLIQYIRAKVPNAKIFSGGSFFKTSDNRDDLINAACAAENVSFSYQSQLDIAENRSVIGAQVYGDDGQWHTVNHTGVASHPGDKGMQAIADIFINQLEL